MEQVEKWEAKVQDICRKLTPPLVVASFDGWYLPQGETDNDRNEAAHRVEAVRRWVEEEVPLLLEQLHRLLGEIKEDVTLQVKSCIAIAAAVHISPRLGIATKDELQVSSSESREPWITAKSRRVATSILFHPLLTFPHAQDSAGASLDTPLVTHILQAYLKPLFSSTSSRSINASTGRAAKDYGAMINSSLVTSSATLMEEEILWKGGDAANAVKLELLGTSVAFDVVGQEPLLQTRHRALGSSNVLYICCRSIQSFQAGQPSSWDQFWPLVLPPLLTLLEDSSPLYRLMASRILNITLLSGSDRGSHVGSLLLRTGVAALMRRSLQSSLTFISTKLSAALLESAAESLILLSRKTTAEMRSTIAVIPYAVQDGGKARFEQLSSLMDEGVLRVWAYAPTSVAALDSDGPESTCSTMAEGASGVHTRVEATDVVNASIGVLLQLTHDDALGLSIARYLDITLEYLTAQMAGLEVKLDRRNAKHRAALPLDREICSAQAMETLLVVCKQAPGVRTWSSLCLDAAARCWTLLQDQRETPQTRLLRQHSIGIIRALLEAQPELVQAQVQRLLELDEATFSGLVGKGQHGD